MKRTFCDCCRNEIFSNSDHYDLVICKGVYKQIAFEDLCQDCYNKIKKTIEEQLD